MKALKDYSFRFTAVMLLMISVSVLSETPNDYKFQFSPAPAQSIWMQVNNINTVFRTDGYFNYDRYYAVGPYGRYYFGFSNCFLIAISRLFAVSVSFGFMTSACLYESIASLYWPRLSCAIPRL